MIELGVPVVRGVTGRALALIMTCGSGMARLTVSETRVVERGIIPIVGVVAGGTLSLEMTDGSGMTGLTIG